MKIYCPANPIRDKRDVFCRLTFANDADRKRFAMGENFRGQPLSAPLLQPYEVKRSTEFPGGDAAPLGDRQAIGINTDPMALSQQALNALLPQIDQLVQVVPLLFDEGEYALLNVLNVVDALVPQTPARAFVTDCFVQLVQQAGLTGFEFEELWSDELMAQEAGS